MKKQNIEVSKLAVIEGTGSADILLYGVVGEDWWAESRETQNTDENFVKTLESLAKKYSRINLRINSPGGSMMHGNAIVSAIQRCSAEVHAYNDGIAASMAADIFMSCKNRHMGKASLLMIHAPSTIAWGNANDMRDTADMLDAFAQTAIGVMAECTGMDEEEIKNTYYDGKDHWLTRKQCADMGILTDEEEYETATPPEGVEKMSFEQVIHLFKEKGKNNINGKESRTNNTWLTKMTAAFWGQNAPEKNHQTTVHPVNDVEMTIDNIKKALEDGTISPEDVQKLLPTPAATTPATEATPATGNLEDTVKKLADTVGALAQKIEKMNTSGTGATQGAFPEETNPAPSGPNPLTDMEKELRTASPGQRFTAY